MRVKYVWLSAKGEWRELDEQDRIITKQELDQQLITETNYLEDSKQPIQPIYKEFYYQVIEE